ncbi:MAG: tetratricopeptide repeat protein, partial [Archangium sp.]
RCYLQGGATCLTCHTAPHVEHAANEIKQPKHPAKGVSVGSASCQGCHAQVFAQGPRHTHHSAAEAQDCVACHMPPTVSGVLDPFADHALDVPAPQNTVKHGIPNACNACHTHEKASPESMVEAMEKWWPEARQRQARRLRLADAIDEKTAADSRPPLEQVLADKKEAPALRGVAALLLAQRFHQEAVPALKAALATATDPGLRSDLAAALAMTGPREVADVLASLLKDKSLWVRQSAALPLAGAGDPRGQAALEELARQPASEALPLPHAVLGQLALRRGDLATGLQQLERSLDLQPYNPEVLVLLADVYARQGDLSRAGEALEEALRFDPQHRGARQRLNLMRNGPGPGH